MTLKDAYFRSCLPCYQQLTRKMGYEHMKAYTKKFSYGEMIFDTASYDSFWVQGASTINQFQQIDFLRRFYHSELPIKKETERIVKEMISVTEGSYELSAKTGWSIQNNVDNGWYVGYLKIENKVFYFATNVTPGEGFDRDDFSAIRKEITIKGFQKLGFI